MSQSKVSRDGSTGRERQRLISRACFDSAEILFPYYKHFKKIVTLMTFRQILKGHGAILCSKLTTAAKFIDQTIPTNVAIKLKFVKLNQRVRYV